MVALEGRGNFPALELKLKDLLSAVKERLVKEGLKIRDIRLNGGAASFALMEEPLDSCLSCGYQNFTANNAISVNRKNSNSTDDGLICSCHISNYEPLLPIIATASSSTDSSLSQSSITSQDSSASSNCCCKSCFSYNDIDLIFGMDLSTAKHFDRVKTAVLDAILDLLPPQVSRKRMSPCALKEAYVSKMVKVCDGDRWSLIALGNGQPISYSMVSPPSTIGSSANNGKSRSCSVELKFVDHMRRQYEFSVDSFQIVLDSLLLFYKCATVPMSRRFYPTVVGESVYGDFNEALYHLHNSQMATRHPEEIRGGGLLKYCSLIVRGYRPADVHAIVPLQRYMCSRFFIDFPEVDQQELKLRTYLANHMSGASSHLRYAFLVTLHSVVDSSTVCLMGHERRLTLNLIQRLAYQLYANDYGSLGGNVVYSTYYMPPMNANNPAPQRHGTVSITSTTAPGPTLTIGGPGGGFTCGLDSQNQQTIYYSYAPTTNGHQNQVYANGCCNTNPYNGSNYQNRNGNGRNYHYNNNNNRQANYNSHYTSAPSKMASATTQTPSASQIKSMTFTNSNVKSSNTNITKDSGEKTVKPITTPTIVIAPPPPPLPASSDTSEIPDSSDATAAANTNSSSSATTSCASASAAATSPPVLLAITASPSA
jgi:hypothetical protein